MQYMYLIHAMYISTNRIKIRSSESAIDSERLILIRLHIYMFKFPSHVLVCVGESFFETLPKNDQNAN